MSNLRGDVRRRLRLHDLRRNLGSTYEARQESHVAAVAGRNLVSIKGQLYNAAIEDAPVGSRLDVVNVGRPGQALYVPKNGGGLVVAGGSSSGSSGSSGGGLSVNDVLALVDSTRGLAVVSGKIRVNLAGTSGLAFDGGGALKVDAYHGIELSANGVAVDLQTTSGLALSASGLAVGAGDGIDVLTSTIAVDVTDIIDTMYGLTESSNNIRISTDANSGLNFGASGGLKMGTPSAVSATSTSHVTSTTHGHAVTASSDVSVSPGAATLLKSTSVGGLGLSSMFTSGAVTVGQDLYSGNSGFRVIYHTHDYDHVHVVINPDGSWSGVDEQFGLDVVDNLLVRGWIVGKHAIQLDGASMLLHFDGPERSATLAGQTRGHMGQAPTAETNLTFAPGKFGKAVAVPASTVNLFTNPSLETGTTSWAAYSTGAATGTRTRTLSQAFAGNYSYELVKTGGADSDRWGVNPSVSGIVSGTTYTISFWINVTQASGGLKRIRLETGGAFGTNFMAGYVEGVTDGWTRVALTLTASSSGTGHIYIYTHDVSTATFYVDALQVEAEDYATAYCDGSLSDHSWSGTAHASTSSRGGATLTYNSEGVINRREGTFMCWFNPTTTSIWEMLFAVGSATWVRAHAGSFQLSFGGVETTGGTATYTANTWTHVAFTWEGDEVNFYVNGTLSKTANPATWGSMNGTLSIGYYNPGNDQRISGLIDDVVFLNRAADADEVKAVYESNAPVFAETSTWHWRAGRNRIWADSEGLWGVGASGRHMLGLYAGDEANPSATKSWGGKSLSEGDFLLGYYGASQGGWLYFDQDLVSSNPGLVFGYADTEVIRFDSGGASLYGVLDIDTNGGIYQGTGTFASPTTGLKIWQGAGGIGRIAGFNGGTVQWAANTSGQLYAGGGAVTLDVDGISLRFGSGDLDTAERIKFMNGATEEGSLGAYSDLTGTYNRLDLTGPGGVQIGLLEAIIGGATVIDMDADDIVLGGNVSSGNITVTGEVVASGDVEGQRGVFTQSSSTANIPALRLEQQDLDKEFINFTATVAAGNPINTTALGSYYGRARVSVNGTEKWIALYNT